MANTINYTIVNHIATLSTSAKGWTKEVNVISWNGGAPKLDIRDWAPEHEKMGKGITLTQEEANALAKAILGGEDEPEEVPAEEVPVGEVPFAAEDTPVGDAEVEEDKPEEEFTFEQLAEIEKARAIMRGEL